jgi:outer membrane protein insertion porin family
VERGDKLDSTSISDGIEALFGLGFFSDIRVLGRRDPGGWTVIIQVKEWPKVSEIRYKGENKIKKDDLKKGSALTAGNIIKASDVEAERQRIVELYAKRGYPAAKVKPVYEQAVKASERVLVFEIEEGEKVKVVAVGFEGNQSFTDKKLRDKVKSKPRSWPHSSYLKSEQLDTDAEELEKFYHNRGYKNAEVKEKNVTYAADGTEATVTFVIEEGTHYTIGDVEVKGNEEMTSARLMSAIRLKPGDEYKEDEVDKSLMALQEIYSDVGYVYATIDPLWVDKTDTLDVVFDVNEGIQSHIEEVKIAGNTRTKEKVIRRELTVKPGDIFSRSSFLRSQREVMALGFFEDVQLSFQPTGPEGDLDVTFDVKEKQTGTAMAGAGYSSDVGLTGFLELGHNNLFGRGQSVMLRLERGTKRNNVDISFTEPWLMDTPTLLGIDLFNMVWTRDIYDEKRAGGAIRIGRRLTWPDYSRVGLSYGLENVTIDNFRGLTPEQEAYFSAEGQQRLTSSVSVSISRNSTDNPFYPTSGSSSIFETEIAGGPLGGDINFRKHTFDHRSYFSTFWKFVLMLRAKVGALSTLTGGTPPSYETFRLGGTGRSDYLRGYPDYEIVPEENVTVASDGTITRYPGGRFALTLTAEYQFPIVNPIHGLFFFDAGDTWTSLSDDFDLGELRKGAGFGVRIEIPSMGMVGFDYGYGFDRDGGGKWEPHLQLGRGF